jgi:hypothetical protein
MELEKTQLEDLKKIEDGIVERKSQLDPYLTTRTLYNPTNGDLYVSVSDKNGNIRRKVINLLGE